MKSNRLSANPGLATLLSIAVLRGGNSAVAADQAPKTGSGPDHHYLHRTEKPHAARWGYRGKIGPTHWGTLSPDYLLAKKGRQQSPIDITAAMPRKLNDIEFRYRPSRVRILYNGHTVEDVQDGRSVIVVDKTEFHLKQFHFHSPSEHTLNGRHTPMEMHLVHASDDGRIAVVAVMIAEGKKDNRSFEPVWGHLPTEENRTREYRELVHTSRMLPAERSYYRYMGSFTTPPCTEQVLWLVMTQPVRLSGRQIADFRRIIDGNNRPTQPLNGRPVYRQTR